MTTLSTVLCLRTSLAADPSPPPIMNTVFGLQLVSVDKSKIQYSFQMSPVLIAKIYCSKLKDCSLRMEEERRVYQRLVVNELIHLCALHLPVDYQSLMENN
jgi:hypothetical protein